MQIDFTAWSCLASLQLMAQGVWLMLGVRAGMLQQGQAAVQQGVGQIGEQGSAIFRQGQSLGEQVQGQAGQVAQQVGACSAFWS